MVTIKHLLGVMFFLSVRTVIMVCLHNESEYKSKFDIMPFSLFFFLASVNYIQRNNSMSFTKVTS